jgi:hypothetical protein
MTLDDDDLIEPDGLGWIVDRCSEELPAGIGGFIYQMAFDDGRAMTPFPHARSNYLRIRADEGVKGDKKEVVLASLIKSRAIDPAGRYRRVPPSLTWARIALTHDTICDNKIVGTKRYLSGGISYNIGRVKRRNAFAMVILYKVHVRAYFLNRYKSWSFLFKAVAGMIVYGIVGVFNSVAVPFREKSVRSISEKKAS